MSFNQTIDHLHTELTRLFDGQFPRITWSWIATTTAQLMETYPTGLTHTTLMADLEAKWEYQRRNMSNHNFDTIVNKYDTERAGDDLYLDCHITQLTFKHDTIWVATLRDTSYREMDMYLPLKCTPWLNGTITGTDFGHARHLRFRCPAAINAPLNNPPEGTPRSDRVICCGPPADVVWQLQSTDGWIKDVFTDTFATVIGPNSMAPTKIHRLWVKILHVEQDEQHVNRHDVYIIDASQADAEPALLCFYDDHATTTRLLKRGDYLGLYAPKVAEPTTASQIAQTDLVFECGPATMLFWMTPKDAQALGMAIASTVEPSSPIHDFFNKPIVPRDDEGISDCGTYAPRIRIVDLAPSMRNITLLGRLVAKANNNPFLADGQRMDRYAIRIQDESGQVDVTLWEQTGEFAKTAMVGHRLLLTGLSTSVQHESAKDTWYVNGSALYNTIVYNVSHYTCLLVSDGLSTLTPLHQIQGDGQWDTEATLVGWKLCGTDPTRPVIDDAHCLADYMVVQGHEACGELVEDRCDYCDQEVSGVWMYRQRKQGKGDKVGWIEWQLDDGHGILDVYGSEKVILGSKAAHFRTLTPQAQRTMLDAALGESWACSISCVGTRGYRLDTVVPARQYQSRCLGLLSSLADLV